jgi:serine/threonine-protein kinase RsbT
MIWEIVEDGENKGIKLTFEDQGPGIPDIEKAMEEGYSTGKGLGLGLPGTKQLMDEMEIFSKVGKGTKITIKKWLKT